MVSPKKPKRYSTQVTQEIRRRLGVTNPSQRITLALAKQHGFPTVQALKDHVYKSFKGTAPTSGRSRQRYSGEVTQAIQHRLGVYGRKLTLKDAHQRGFKSVRALKDDTYNQLLETGDTTRYPKRFSARINKQIKQRLGITDAHQKVSLPMALQRGFKSVKALKNHIYGLIKEFPEDLWLAAMMRGEFEESPDRIKADAARRERLALAANKPEWLRLMSKRVEILLRGDHARPDPTMARRYRAQAQATVEVTLVRVSWQQEDLEQEEVTSFVVQGQLGQLFMLAQERAEELLLLAQEQSGFKSVELRGEPQFKHVSLLKTNGSASLADIPMTAIKRLRIAGLPQSYKDSGRGMCVFDALKYMYVGQFKDVGRKCPTGLKKYFDKEENFWADIKGAYHQRMQGQPDHKPDYDPAVSGVAAADLWAGFCEPQQISMYMLDMRGLVDMMKPHPKRHTQRPPLCFRHFGKHILLDMVSVKSLSQVRDANGFVQRQEAREAKGGFKKASLARGDDSLTRVAAGDDRQLVPVEEQSGLEHLVEFIKNTGSVPDAKHVHICGGKVVSYKTEEHAFVFGQQLDAVRDTCRRMDLPWEGHTWDYLLHQLIEKNYGKNGVVRGKVNPEVLAILRDSARLELPSAERKGTVGLKGRAQVGWLDSTYQYYESCELSVRDISKCHAACLYDPVEEWALPSYNDHPVIYPKPMGRYKPKKAGLYYVLADSTSALWRKGSNWYSRAVVQRAFDEGLSFKVGGHIHFSIKLPKDYFRPLLHDFVVATDGNPQLYKELFNRLSGYLGKDVLRRTAVYFENNKEAYQVKFQDYVCNKGYKAAPVHPLVDGWFMATFEHQTELMELATPIYLQILDNQSLRVMNMEQAHGGEPVARKVDCTILTRVTRPNPEQTIDLCKPPSDALQVVRQTVSSWGRWREAQEVPVIKRPVPESLVPLPAQLAWKDLSHISDSNQWKEVYKHMLQHNRVLIEGGPGTGKTYTGLYVAHMLAQQRKPGLEGAKHRVKFLSFTNLAALNIGGQTLHRGLGLRTSGEKDDEPLYYSKKHLLKVAQTTDVIVVDELSLLPVYLLAVLYALLELKPSLKVILIGDPDQCPPVEPDSEDGWPHYFQHSFTKALAGGFRVVLTARHRACDPQLGKLLDALKVDYKCKVPAGRFQQGLQKRNLCWTTACRDAVNRMLNLQHKPADAVVLREPEELWVHPGLPLQAHKSLKKAKWDQREDKQHYWLNNEVFTVTKVGTDQLELYRRRKSLAMKNGVLVTEEWGHTVVCPLEQVQMYFRLGYATTVHSSQGETILEDFTIWEWERMSRQLRYTAVGRAKTLAQIHVPPPEVRVSIDADTKELSSIASKLKTYRKQDLDGGHRHPDEDYPTPLRILTSLRNCGCACERCGREMNIKPSAPNDPLQWTLQRLDNRQGHIRSNVASYCWKCNRAHPEQNFLAPEEEE